MKLFLDANLPRVSLQVEEAVTAKSRPLVRLEPLRAKASVGGFHRQCTPMKIGTCHELEDHFANQCP
jgi:hypothetical protein